MAADFEYALMAGRSYQSTRKDVNWFPVPNEWREIAGAHRVKSSGFEATAFKKLSSTTNEIVISFAGTGPGFVLTSKDWWTNFELTKGECVQQLRDAAAYYMDIKKKNANATITFTGHSLGGGIAAILGVLFDVQATTFDQAPFSRSCCDSVRNDLKSYLLSLRGEDNELLYDESDLQALSSFTNLEGREGNVQNIVVDDEILSTFLVDILPGRRIGVPEILNHGCIGASASDLHAQSLMTLFLMNGKLRDVTMDLNDLVSMMNDEDLFYNDPEELGDNAKENFAERLIKYEVAADPEQGMLTRFTNDLYKICTQGGLTMATEAMQKALTAFAMQKYYTEQPDSTSELFNNEGITEGCGLHFKMSDVAASLTGDDGAKGYNLYFDNYLNTWKPEEKEQAKAVLEGTKDWYVQAGVPALKAKAGDQRAFMIGGGANDVLYGGKGQDKLTGGAGDDLLIGGEGADSYYFRFADGSDTDTIIDSGKNNTIYVQRSASEKMAIVKNVYGTDNNQYNTIDGEVIVTRNSNRLELPNGSHVDLPLSIDDFGINPIDIPENPVTGNTIDIDPEEPGNTYGTAQSDRINGTSGGDSIIDSYGGNDYISLRRDAAGYAVIEGGAGTDVVQGSIGNDALFGGIVKSFLSA